MNEGRKFYLKLRNSTKSEILDRDCVMIGSIAFNTHFSNRNVIYEFISVWGDQFRDWNGTYTLTVLKLP